MALSWYFLVRQKFTLNCSLSLVSRVLPKFGFNAKNLELWLSFVHFRLPLGPAVQGSCPVPLGPVSLGILSSTTWTSVSRDVIQYHLDQCLGILSSTTWTGVSGGLVQYHFDQCLQRYYPVPLGSVSRDLVQYHLDRCLWGSCPVPLGPVSPEMLSITTWTSV